MLLFCALELPASAADLNAAPAAAAEAAPAGLREALSRYLSLEMVRATFDVAPRAELGPDLAEKAARWEAVPPSADEIADIDQQLLAEASYYIVSLSYLVQVGGAVFPSDKAENVYVNDTIVRLDDLRRRLFAAVDEGADVLPILAEVEQIRALTEGYRTIPDGFGLFDQHESLLDQVLETRPKAGATPA
jgi:hypothetical protein